MGSWRGSWDRRKTLVEELVKFKQIYLTNILLSCKKLTLGETGQGIYGNPLDYLCHFSINLKLFQHMSFAFLNMPPLTHTNVQVWTMKNMITWT